MLSLGLELIGKGDMKKIPKSGIIVELPYSQQKSHIKQIQVHP